MQWARRRHLTSLFLLLAFSSPAIQSIRCETPVDGNTFITASHLLLFHFASSRTSSVCLSSCLRCLRLKPLPFFAPRGCASCAFPSDEFAWTIHDARHELSVRAVLPQSIRQTYNRWAAAEEAEEETSSRRMIVCASRKRSRSSSCYSNCV